MSTWRIQAVVLAAVAWVAAAKFPAALSTQKARSSPVAPRKGNGGVGGEGGI